MPPTRRYNNPSLFGGPANGCVFAIVDWKNFLGALAQEYATVVGTITEAASPYGTALRIGAGASYVTVNWRSLCPEGASPRSIFTQAYFPDNGNFGTASFGGAGVRDYTFVGPASPNYWGGLNGDWDSSLGGTQLPGWETIALTNAGINGGANIIYAQGTQQVAGTNGAVAVSTYDSLYLMDIRGAVHCPVGSMLQVIIVFSRVITAAEVLELHKQCVAAKLLRMEC